MRRFSAALRNGLADSQKPEAEIPYCAGAADGVGAAVVHDLIGLLLAVRPTATTSLLFFISYCTASPACISGLVSFSRDRVGRAIAALQLVNHPVVRRMFLGTRGVGPRFPLDEDERERLSLDPAWRRNAASDRAAE